MIELNQVSYRYEKKWILRGITYSFQPNRFYGIIGPNGTGKSTLLQMIAGVTHAEEGEIRLEAQNVARISRKALAKRLAVLQQGGLPALEYTVLEIIEMGRYPFQSWLGHEKGDHRSLIEYALEITGLSEFRNRRLAALSGGERQRVALAKMIVQQPQILLLDEPTTYLDLGYQQSIMELVRKWQMEQGMLVIAVMHDLNLAAMYCDELIALHQGHIVAKGSPDEVITEQLVQQLYDANSIVIQHPTQHVPQLLIQPKEGE